MALKKLQPCSVCGKTVFKNEQNDIIGAKVSFGEFSSHDIECEILCGDCYEWLYSFTMEAFKSWVPLFPFVSPIPHIVTNW